MRRPTVYFAISADLVNSRGVRDRAGFARQLKKTLAALGQRFEGDWLRPPVIARGIDEVSAALKRPDHAFDALVTLNLGVWPQRFRAGVGVGHIDVGLHGGDAADLDGTAFHNASEAIRRAARDGQPFAIAAPGISTPQIRMAEALAAFHARTMADWRPQMHRSVVAYRQTGTQHAAARKLRSTQQSISRSLGRARHEDLLRGEECLRHWLVVLQPTRDAG